MLRHLAERRAADHDGDADQPEHDAEHAVERELLVRCRDMGDQRGENRRRGIEDRGDAARTYCWPQASSVNGMTLLMMPMIRNDVHACRVIGRVEAHDCGSRYAARLPRSARAAATMVSGGNSHSATATK